MGLLRSSSLVLEESVIVRVSCVCFFFDSVVIGCVWFILFILSCLRVVLM